jgi:hypothetical protein
VGPPLGWGGEGWLRREALRRRSHKRFVKEVRRMDVTGGNGMGSRERGTRSEGKDRPGGVGGRSEREHSRSDVEECRGVIA